MEEIVSYEFSGIQNFIFGRLSIRSLKGEIGERSKYIESLTEKCRDYLDENLRFGIRMNVLSMSSGRIICRFSGIHISKSVKDISDELQRIVYASTDGLVELYYGLDGDHVSMETNKFHCLNLLNIDMSEYIRNDFVPDFKASDPENEIPTGRIYMAIKFDLDNLGNFFQQFGDNYEDRKKASESLNQAMKNVFKNLGLDEVQEIFIGGDDIFAIAPLECYLTTVSTMRGNLIDSINSDENLKLYRECFGISGGISMIRNENENEPLIYYFDSSEEALELAKAQPGKNSVVIEDKVYSWDDIDRGAKTVRQKTDEFWKHLDLNRRMLMLSNLNLLKRE